MARPAHAPDRVKYRSRIGSLLSNPPKSSEGTASDTEVMAHWAKYVCVLVSGYIEQAVKEVLLEHSSAAPPKVSNYIERTWPKSKNMYCASIAEILEHFDTAWFEAFNEWIRDDERKKEINEIIIWRNNIAHGKESTTNNVTIGSVKTKFKTACDLVDFLESVIQS